MIKVEFNKKNENPFYGMGNTLEIYQRASKNMAPTSSSLEGAWGEAKTLEQKAVLFSILFFVGDVTNRQHNIFGGKVENGGNSQREVFRQVLVPFMWSKVKSMSARERQHFLRLIAEYTTMDNILATRVVTRKKRTSVSAVINMIEVFGEDEVVKYCANVINKGTVFQKMCLAKFLTRPRFSKRTGKAKMLPETRKTMAARASLIKAVSDACNLPYEEKDSYINFSGYYEWRKQFNENFESVLFSSQTVKDMDKQQFLELVDKAPSDARFRIRNRVMFSDKWGQLKEWYQEWENFKSNAQEEQRKLENKVEQGIASEEDKKKLAKVKKDAKVNTGAVSFTKLMTDVVNGNVDRVKVQPFMDKITLPYNSLVFVDDSGSMGSGWNSNFPYTPRQFAAFIATVCLSKNPDPEARDLMGMFSSHCRMINGITSMNDRPNSLLNGKTIKTLKQPLINKEDHFLDNLSRMMRFLNDNSTARGTNISSLPDHLNSWVNGDPEKLEQLQNYPIWTLVSDGNFNNLGNASSSLNDFMRRCENYFGYRPYLILIDVAGDSSQPITQFSGIDNVMMVPPNPSNIEMLLTNFRDMDVYDVYTPLLSLYRSNRYAPIRQWLGVNQPEVAEQEDETPVPSSASVV